MKSMTITNNKTKSLKTAANLLNNCEMLMIFTVEREGNRTVLHILADGQKFEYSVIKEQDMISFLNDLKYLVNHPEDVEEVLEELKELE
ncbi:hypothetical protein [Bacillus safensis]|uniref:hypothetical protein n=1 Tax=Bacillus safensis TaxID=561879 RepID=UPI002282A55C|nr:hypothetical protein [Bacillus safensis]MCY7707980.1 hypothetical protein [Bacillus safensis]MCY7728026.1 hypothetical protein [Bacillus safensis]